MIITAKFPSVCPCCSSRIAVGAKVEWSKGAKARHVKCPAASAPKAKPIRKVAPKAKADMTGCKHYSRRSQDRWDNYEVGQVLYLSRSDEYVTVVAVDRKWRDDDSDEWMIGCYARPATEAEIAPVAARRAEAQRKADLAAIPARVASQVKHADHCTDERVPADAWRLVLGSRLAGSETLYVTADALWLVTSSYDDGPRTWRMSITSAHVEAIASVVSGLAA